jgi:hypothetical protein
MTVPAGAGAQSRPSDPEADSPSGVVYELPVDRARKDAAPRRGPSQSPDNETGSAGGDSVGGGSSGGGTTGGDGSAAGANDTSIRSENNFGTSSRVPGASNRARGGGSDAPGEADGGGPVDTLGQLAPSSAAGADGPTDSVVFLLLAALVGVGAVIGVVAGRRAARGQRG